MPGPLAGLDQLPDPSENLPVLWKPEKKGRMEFRELGADYIRTLTWEVGQLGHMMINIKKGTVCCEKPLPYNGIVINDDNDDMLLYKITTYLSLWSLPPQSHPHPTSQCQGSLLFPGEGNTQKKLAAQSITQNRVRFKGDTTVAMSLNPYTKGCSKDWVNTDLWYFIIQLKAFAASWVPQPSQLLT